MAVVVLDLNSEHFICIELPRSVHSYVCRLCVAYTHKPYVIRSYRPLGVWYMASYHTPRGLRLLRISPIVMARFAPIWQECGLLLTTSMIWAPLRRSAFVCVPVISSSVPARTCKACSKCRKSASLPRKKTIEPSTQGCGQLFWPRSLPVCNKGSRGRPPKRLYSGEHPAHDIVGSIGLQRLEDCKIDAQEEACPDDLPNAPTGEGVRTVADIPEH